jgi:hypothetical protein
MPNHSEFAIRLVYDHRPDGRFHISSPDIPGLHLNGPNLEGIAEDIEPLVRELLLHNSGVVVDTIKWVPPLEEMVNQMRRPTAGAREPSPGESRVLVITGRAA